MSATHSCRALNCTQKVQRKFLMCYFHWAALPNAIREAVCMAYTPGQESGRKKIKPEWVKASRDAIIYIADREGVDFMDDYGKPIENEQAPPQEDTSQDLD